MKKPKPIKMKTAQTPTVVSQTASEAKPAAAVEAKKMFNPFVFFSEVRTEGRRISWPSMKETWITTVMVMIMVILAGVFFYVVDAVMGQLVNLLVQALA
jgi:preprotein translocase subunit SecE